MTYMHINTVNYDDLDDQEKANWLQAHEGDGFVLITDGDESLQRDFESNVLSLDQVLDEVPESGSIIFAEDAPNIAGFIKSKSYWGDDKLTRD